MRVPSTRTIPLIPCFRGRACLASLQNEIPFGFLTFDDGNRFRIDQGLEGGSAGGCPP